MMYTPREGMDEPIASQKNKATWMLKRAEAAVKEKMREK
jgi:hypothetical protein